MYTVTNAGTLDFCPSMSLFTYNASSGQWEASCTEIGVPCFILPICSGATPCNFSFKVNSENCLGYKSGSIPFYQYAIQFGATNTYSYPLNYTLSSSQGAFYFGGTGILNPGYNSITTGFNDNLAFDSYFCVLLTVSDPTTNTILCEEWTCFPVKPCTQQNCIIDAKWVSIACNGTDAFGNPQYLIDMLISNMFGSSASASISFLSTNGIFSNITPSILSPGANLTPVQFIYTDFGGSGMVCFSMQQTNTINGSYCYMDYNSNPICCQNLPGCPKPAPKGLLLKNEQSILKSTDNSNQLKVQPNPSNGSALIYYKMAATNSCTDCKIRIMETGSGKVVCEKMLELPVGTISIKDCNLAEGHYIVTLWNSDQLIISNKLEIVK